MQKKHILYFIIACFVVVLLITLFYKYSLSSIKNPKLNTNNETELVKETYLIYRERFDNIQNFEEYVQLIKDMGAESVQENLKLSVTDNSSFTEEDEEGLLLLITQNKLTKINFSQTNINIIIVNNTAMLAFGQEGDQFRGAAFMKKEGGSWKIKSDVWDQQY